MREPTDKSWSVLYGKPSFSIPKSDPEAAARAIMNNMKPHQIVALLEALNTATSKKTERL